MERLRAKTQRQPLKTNKVGGFTLNRHQQILKTYTIKAEDIVTRINK